MYGLKTKDETSESLKPAMKPTRFIINSPHMLKHLNRRCHKSHKHQPLEGGRCADAAFCPLPLIRAILRGMHYTAKADEHERETNLEGRRHIAALMFAATKGKPEPGESVPIGKTEMQKLGGGESKIDFKTINLNARYFDEYTGEALPNDVVRAATMPLFCEKSTWTAADYADMKSTLVRMRWVLCN